MQLAERIHNFKTTIERKTGFGENIPYTSDQQVWDEIVKRLRNEKPKVDNITATGPTVATKWENFGFTEKGKWNKVYINVHGEPNDAFDSMDNPLIINIFAPGRGDYSLTIKDLQNSRKPGTLTNKFYEVGRLLGAGLGPDTAHKGTVGSAPARRVV